ncbi:protein adenylyltransferase Fic [Hyphomicrobium sp.]|uniref:protein adenylyltransferase Fic n=1 Tax=Hyphomicrobium sp. TaxID=82 RepID=UPI0025BAAE17|nr:Fic/DOC family N-terminal domain-containing protein [Hyphomicrobium sp.]MCC7253555.1 Fic family protein [Hyphomicrobium sp.]
MSFDPNRPFNDLPGLPPRVDLETRSVLKTCVSARAKLAALKEAAALIPNQDVLINSIPLREAKDSSAIENIVTTNDKLFRFANADANQADTATKETLRYRTALLCGYESLKSGRPLTTNTAVEVCRAIKDVDLDIRRTSGTNLKNQSGRVIYTPPEGEDVLRDKMANWERFIHDESDLDPLIRMAVAHYQFEAIHPFPDGNGRTGRILNILFLIEMELLDLPILYLSRFINDQRGEYYRLLLEVTTQQAWEPWVLYMLNAVDEMATWTRSKIWAIKHLMADTVRYVQVALPKVYKRELVELLFVQPYVRIGDLVDAGLGTRKTAAGHLNQLIAAGVLRAEKEGRDKLFINVRFFDLLMSDSNDFAPFPEVAAER